MNISFLLFQGLYIFIVYVILRNQMRHAFNGKYQVRQPPEIRIQTPSLYGSEVKKYSPEKLDLVCYLLLVYFKVLVETS